MLRSLVGSEMCIRDRGTCPAPLPHRRQGGLVRLHFLAVGGHALDHLESCLLYTSDAADDLLCVDLGGRRIIKKKKQNKHARTNDRQAVCEKTA